MRNVPYYENNDKYDEQKTNLIVVPIQANESRIIRKNFITNIYFHKINLILRNRWRKLLPLLTYVGFWLLTMCHQKSNYPSFLGMGVLAAPQSCVLCEKEDLKPNKYPPERAYEEFLFEHQVTRHDAINALRALNNSFNNGLITENVCKSVSCTKKVMKYCLGPQFINDHCWCELGHTDEGLPFVPHICYVGEKIYTPAVGSCFFYEEVKECCCSPVLARQWRHISAAPSINRLDFGHYINSLLMVSLIFLVNMYLVLLK